MSAKQVNLLINASHLACIYFVVACFISLFDNSEWLKSC